MPGRALPEREMERMKEEMQALVEAFLATPDTPEFRRGHDGKSPREVTETQWHLLHAAQQKASTPRLPG